MGKWAYFLVIAAMRSDLRCLSFSSRDCERRWALARSAGTKIAVGDEERGTHGSARQASAPRSGATVPRAILAGCAAAPRRGLFVFVSWVRCAHPRLLLLGRYAPGSLRTGRSSARRADGYEPGVSPPDRPPNDPCSTTSTTRRGWPVRYHPRIVRPMIHAPRQGCGKRSSHVGFPAPHPGCISSSRAFRGCYPRLISIQPCGLRISMQPSV